jgi:hypothetical protein
MGYSAAPAGRIVFDKKTVELRVPPDSTIRWEWEFVRLVEAHEAEAQPADGSAAAGDPEGREE